MAGFRVLVRRASRQPVISIAVPRSAHLTFCPSGDVWAVEKDTAMVCDYEEHTTSPTSRSGEVHLE